MAAGGADGMDPRIAPGVFLWLDADQIPRGPDGTIVATWPNRFGVAADAKNDANPSRRPTYLNDGGNGKPGVFFNNAHSLTGAHGQDMTQGFSVWTAHRVLALPVGKFGTIALNTNPGGAHGVFVFPFVSPAIYLSNSHDGDSIEAYHDLDALGSVVVTWSSCKPFSPIDARVNGRPPQRSTGSAFYRTAGASLQATADYKVGGNPASGDELTGVIFDVVYSSQWLPPAIGQAVAQFLANKNRAPGR